MSTLRRYARTPVLGFGKQYGTSQAIPALRENIENGNIRYTALVLQENERLDILAGEFYGDGRLWWLIAAASNIGWGLQVPAGTEIKVPNINDCAQYVG